MINSRKGLLAHPPATGGNIGFVGGGRSQVTGDNPTHTIPTLVGGSSGTLSEDDLLVICIAARVDSGTNPAATGYTQAVASEDNQSKSDTVCHVFYKIQGATPDTTIAMTTLNLYAPNTSRLTYAAFSGVDTTTPMDVAATIAQSANGVQPNPPSITPTTAGAWVVIFGEHQLQLASSDDFAGGDADYTIDSWLGPANNSYESAMGYWDGWTSGAEDPAAFTGFAAYRDMGYGATLALRPA